MCLLACWCWPCRVRCLTNWCSPVHRSSFAAVFDGISAGVGVGVGMFVVVVGILGVLSCCWPVRRRAHWCLCRRTCCCCSYVDDVVAGIGGFARAGTVDPFVVVFVGAVGETSGVASVRPLVVVELAG